MKARKDQYSIHIFIYLFIFLCSLSSTSACVGCNQILYLQNERKKNTIIYKPKEKQTSNEKNYNVVRKVSLHSSLSVMTIQAIIFSYQKQIQDKQT